MLRKELKPEDGCSTRPRHAPRDKPITADQEAFEEKRTLLSLRFGALARNEKRRHEELARREREHQPSKVLSDDSVVPSTSNGQVALPASLA